MNVREMRTLLGDTQSEFAARYHIPLRTIQNWETGVRNPSGYIVDLLESRVRSDCVNRKTVTLPEYDPGKRDLPSRSDYVGALAWLMTVRECLGESFVFALDEALMCQGYFGGRSEEFIIWGYGSDDAARFNGVVLLGNEVSPYNVEERNGLRYTDFNRTLADALANESILDMQGITEALGRYYYKNGESFAGIFVVPGYQDGFSRLADSAVDYYTDQEEMT